MQRKVKTGAETPWAAMASEPRNLPTYMASMTPQRASAISAMIRTDMVLRNSFLVSAGMTRSFLKT